MNRSLLFALVPFLCLVSDIYASNDDPLLEVVRLAHRASRQSIREFSCTCVMQEIKPNRTTFANDKYFRKGNVIAIKNGIEGKSTHDSLIRDGKCRIVGRDWKDGTISYHAILKTDVQYFSWGDVWRRMMIDHSDHDGRGCNYDMVLDRIGPNARVSRERIDDRDCVLIEVEETQKSGRETVLKHWHDIGHQYWIRRMESYNAAEPQNRSVMVIEQFEELAPGIVFPTHCRTEIFRNNEVIKTYETSISNIQINQPIDEQIFTLPAIPKGTPFQDFIRGTKGQIGPNWKPSGPSKPMRRDILTPESTETVPGQPSTSEPWTLNHYLLLGSAILFLVCMASLVLRRVRSVKDDSDSSP